MDGLLPESLSINQTTGIRFVVKIEFNNLTTKYADKDLIKRQVVLLRFFICVVRDPYSIIPNCISDVFKIH